MQQAQLPPVGFQTEILFGDKPYMKPLYDSGFLDCSDDEACQMLADIEKGVFDWINAKSFLDKYPRLPVHNSFSQTIWQCCPGLRESDFAECKRLIVDNRITKLDYIRCEVKTLVAMRYLYLLCFQTIDNPPGNSQKVECCLLLLEAVSRYVETAGQGIDRYYNFLNPVLEYIHSSLQRDDFGGVSPDDKIQRRIKRPMVRSFPLADVFPGFMAQYDSKYKRYNVSTKPHKTIDATDSASSNGAFAPWWKVECCWESVQLDYRCYCRSLDLPKDLKDTLVQADAVQLAGFLIDNLDLRLNKAVEGTVPVLSARNGLVSWSARKIVQAEYLCLFRDLLQNKQFRICPICKLVFTVQGRGVTRVYCNNHTRNQIEYYKRRISKPHAE